MQRGKWLSCSFISIPVKKTDKNRENNRKGHSDWPVLPQTALSLTFSEVLPVFIGLSRGKKLKSGKVIEKWLYSVRPWRPSITFWYLIRCSQLPWTAGKYKMPEGRRRILLLDGITMIKFWKEGCGSYIISKCKEQVQDAKKYIWWNEFCCGTDSGLIAGNIVDRHQEEILIGYVAEPTVMQYIFFLLTFQSCTTSHFQALDITNRINCEDGWVEESRMKNEARSNNI